jgi:hypothetical protein
MSTLENKYDTIEKMIYEDGIRIEAIDLHPELDVMLIILNTKAVLRQQLSAYGRLKGLNKTELQQFEITGGGTGIYWPTADEDLSLKGFLRDALKQVINSNNTSKAA